MSATHTCCQMMEQGQAALARGSSGRVVEAAWARMVRTGRMALVASEDQRFSRHDLLLVSSDRGDAFARALSDSARKVLSPDAYMRVNRRIPPQDADNILARDRSRADEGRKAFVDMVRRHRLDMHLSEVEPIHGDSRIVFYFSAPGRVDFRNLVRDLASTLHARIDLRQIGVRDEARATGGLGPCGQPLCCATFLREFTAVTIRMAKVQGLVPNPQKVSGLCGRLMCCLAYEHEVYCEMMKTFPKAGTLVETPKGPGKIKELLVMRNMVKVAIGPGQLIDVPLSDIKIQTPAGGAPAAPEPEDDGAADETPAE